MEEETFISQFWDEFLGQLKFRWQQIGSWLLQSWFKMAPSWLSWCQFDFGWHLISLGGACFILGGTQVGSVGLVSI